MREFHPAVDANAVDQMLKEYLVLEEALKPLKKRLEFIKDWCKDQGSFATENYVVSVKSRTQDRLAGLSAAIETLGLETLEKHGLVQQIEVTLVNVSKKA